MLFKISSRCCCYFWTLAKGRAKPSQPLFRAENLQKKEEEAFRFSQSLEIYPAKRLKLAPTFASFRWIAPFKCEPNNWNQHGTEQTALVYLAEWESKTESDSDSDSHFDSDSESISSQVSRQKGRIFCWLSQREFNAKFVCLFEF